MVDIKTLQRKSTPQTTKSIRVDIDAEQLGQLKNAGIEVQVLVNESVNEVCEKLVTILRRYSAKAPHKPPKASGSILTRNSSDSSRTPE